MVAETREARESAASGDAVTVLMLEVTECFFRMRAAGQKSGLVTRWGAASFGFLRNLALRGPLTVPQIARLHCISRQRTQRFADELAAEGLVEFADNQRHRRSKLVRLTLAGHAACYADANALGFIAERVRAGLDEEAVEVAIRTVRRMSERLAADF